MREGSGHRIGVVVAVSAVAGYGWWATGFKTFTWPDRVAIALPAVVVLAVAYAARRPRVAVATWWRDLRAAPFDPAHRRRLVGSVTWLVVVALLVAWELFSYLMSPRSRWPTLSSLLVAVDWSHPVRLVTFLLWIALGVDFLRA